MRVRQLEKEIFSILSTLLNESQRATDVLKYPTKFTEMEKSKLTRCRIDWTMDSTTRVHLYVAPVIDLFGKVFEEIVLRLNRSLASFTLIDLAAFIFFQETWIAEIESYISQSKFYFFFYFIFFLLQKRNLSIDYYYYFVILNNFRIVCEYNIIFNLLQKKKKR